jgi:hypothetical protein
VLPGAVLLSPTETLKYQNIMRSQQPDELDGVSTITPKDKIIISMTLPFWLS